MDIGENSLDKNFPYIESDQQMKQKTLGSHLIARLTSQIHSIKTSAYPNQERSEEIKKTALQVLRDVEMQKEKILGEADGSVLSIAKEMTEELFNQTKELKRSLDECLEDPNTSSVDWIEEAKLWVQIYSKWHDNDALGEELIKHISKRTSQQISKDLQVIDEYQNQSIAGLKLKGEELDTLRERLKSAIDEPLKMMDQLKETPGNLSMEKIGEWVALVQEKRESCFNAVLHKIENVVKEAEPFIEEVRDPAYLIEVGNEIAAIKQELADIQLHFNQPGVLDEVKKYQLQMHLESLLEDAERIPFQLLPSSLKNSLKSLIADILASLARLGLDYEND